MDIEKLTAICIKVVDDGERIYNANDFDAVSFQLWVTTATDIVKKVDDKLVWTFSLIEGAQRVRRFDNMEEMQIKKKHELLAKIDYIKGLPKLCESRLELECLNITNSIIPQPTRKHFNNRKVFLVHGRDDAKKSEVARFIESQGFELTILGEQPHKGKTIIEKFENNAEEIDFAIVILTGDDEARLQKIYWENDETPELKLQARPNVIFELGYFTAYLKRQRVCVLHDNASEILTDYGGVGWHFFDQNGGWKIKLLRELSATGFKVDFNKLDSK